MISTASSDCPPARGGFTLVEAMSAIAILSIILILLVQILAGTMRLTTGSYTKIKADAEARGIFSRLSFDTEAMIRDSNNSLVVSANQITIGLAAGGAGTSNRGGVAVYALTASGLQRQTRDLLWSETALGPFQDNAANSAIPVMDAQVLGPSVIAMEVRIILADGTVTNATSAAAVQTFQSASYPKFLVVGVALTDTQQMKNLGVANPGTTVATVPGSKLPLPVWSAAAISTRAQGFFRYYQSIIKIQ